MLDVNEIFGPTIQGEGRSIGKEVLFLRLSKCNLACIWCDTPYTWNWIGTPFSHPEKFDRTKEAYSMKVADVLIRLNRLSEKMNQPALVISGGEPILQQDSLIDLLRLLKRRNWWIEIETNGTIVPSDKLLMLIDQINCSPKLENSGLDNRLAMRIRPEALRKIANSTKSIFKFVVSSENDIQEILHLVKDYGMISVYLMPEGRTKLEQEQNQQKIKELSQVYGFHFSQRLHVLQWDTKRGV